MHIKSRFLYGGWEVKFSLTSLPENQTNLLTFILIPYFIGPNYKRKDGFIKFYYLETE